MSNHNHIKHLFIWSYWIYCTPILCYFSNNVYDNFKIIIWIKNKVSELVTSTRISEPQQVFDDEVLRSRGQPMFLVQKLQNLWSVIQLSNYVMWWFGVICGVCKKKIGQNLILNPINTHFRVQRPNLNTLIYLHRTSKLLCCCVFCRNRFRRVDTGYVDSMCKLSSLKNLNVYFALQNKYKINNTRRTQCITAITDTLSRTSV